MSARYQHHFDVGPGHFHARRQAGGSIEAAANDFKAWHSGMHPPFRDAKLRGGAMIARQAFQCKLERFLRFAPGPGAQELIAFGHGLPVGCHAGVRFLQLLVMNGLNSLIIAGVHQRVRMVAVLDR